MMQQEHFLWELEEKILYMVPLKSLVRFRSVCKRWNALLNYSRFINNHLARARPQFMLLSESKNCSVEVNLDGPSIKVSILPSDIPDYKHASPMSIAYFEGILIYATVKGFGICNPWLKHIRWIKSKQIIHRLSGMGYDNSTPGKHYKIFGSYYDRDTMNVDITEFGSNARTSYVFSYEKWSSVLYNYTVSLNGTLYWIEFSRSTRQHFIRSFDFSVDIIKTYCILPGKHDPYNVRALEIFRGDRFSILEQDHITRTFEIWVTKDKIKNGYGEFVEWVKFMKVLVPNWSSLIFDFIPPSYFIDDKSGNLVLCCFGKSENTYIYIVKGDKFHEIEINELVGFKTRHRTYYPSLVPLPTGENDEVMSRFAFPRGIEASNGVGEKEWDDGFFDNVKKISVGYNHIGVVFVKFDYSSHNGVVTGASHGNIGTHIPHDDLTIDDDDYIEAVEGTYNGSHITSLMFRLHKEKVTRQYGHQIGTPFVLRGGGGRSWKINGFYGRNSDVHLTAFGVHRNASI